MENELLSQEEAATARACGIGVFAPFESAFAEKCRQMKLDLPEEDGEALMLEYDLSSPFMLGIVIVFGVLVVFMAWHLMPPEVSVLMAALLMYGCVSLLRSRLRLFIGVFPALREISAMCTNGGRIMATFFTQEDGKSARELGIGVFRPSDREFADKCAALSLPPEETSAPGALMLEYRSRLLVLFVMGMVFCGAMLFCLFQMVGDDAATWPILLAFVVLAAVGAVVGLLALLNRQRLVFVGDSLYIGDFSLFRWTVQAVEPEDAMAPYWVKQGNRGSVLRLHLEARIEGETFENDFSVLPVVTPLPILEWTFDILNRWQTSRKRKAASPEETA